MVLTVFITILNRGSFETESTNGEWQWRKRIFPREVFWTLIFIVTFMVKLFTVFFFYLYVLKDWCVSHQRALYMIENIIFF